MKLKLDENGNVVVKDGKPVYETDDGKEFVADVPDMHSKMTSLGRENKQYREQNAELKKITDTLGDVDPKEAVEALDKIKTIDTGKLTDAEEVNRRISEVKAAYEPKLTEAQKEAQRWREAHDSEKLTNAFATSKFVSGNIAVPVGMIQKEFGGNFKIENGKIVPYDSNGNMIFSHSKPSEPATFDEAIETLVNQYPHKDAILKSTGHSGGGNGTGNPGGTGRKISRSEFEQMPPDQQRTVAGEAKTGKVTITD